MADATRAIDIHAHIMPPKWDDLASRFGISGWPWVKQRSTCAACIMLGDREFREVTDQCFVPARRISDMDSGHVHQQLLSPIPRPLKNVFCLGLNYREHVAEGARAGVRSSAFELA